MDEHVGKPFDIDQFVAVLLRHGSKDHGIGVPAAAMAGPDRETTLPLPPVQPLQAAALDSALARLDFAEAADRCQAILRPHVA